MDESGAERLIHTYGRRRGRRLRESQRTLLETLLPQVAIVGSSEPLDPRTLFGPETDQVWLEIGFGGGEHLAAQAAAHPNVGVVGCEPFVNGVVSLLGQIKARQLGNVRIWPSDARALIARFPDASIARAFILFPDPWPKSRHHKRRLIAPLFLDALARVLTPGAELRVATDDADYLAWSLERLTAHNKFRWCARSAADWRVRPADWPPTRYEQKAVAAGRRPAYLRFMRVPAEAAASGRAPAAENVA
ncbi:MAG TPA: tRNA (guanosine(46)-N7)-methyltransferase TrmB [Alphaproteobacteria bacterium]|nr:tRNA (guanosine(46)-N7)-methyltransferase TrmB [Alphaproteobacteria bacterium]